MCHLGFANRDDAYRLSQKNVLMIIGKWDVYREQMTGERDIEEEWMESPQTQNAILVEYPRLGVDEERS